MFRYFISFLVNIIGPEREILILIAYAQKPSLNAHTGIQTWLRGITFDQSFPSCASNTNKTL